MIEKLFGRKTTGIVTLICSGLILIALGFYVVMYLLGSSSPMDLLGYALFCGTALIIILLPHLLQKRFKFYIPSFIVIMLSVFVVIYLLSDILPNMGNTRAFAGVIPMFGGAAISMIVFSIIVSYLYYLFDKRCSKRSVSAVLTAIVTFALSALIVLIWHLAQYFVAVFFFKQEFGVVIDYLWATMSYYIGISVFCVIGAVQIHLNDAEHFRIKSYKDTAAAKKRALDSGDKGFYKVIRNHEKDETNYRGLFLSAKSKFLLGKIVYYGLYIGYLVHIIIIYYRSDRVLNLALIIAMVAAFVLSVTISIYEYGLFRKKAVSKTLFRLKIIKSSIRLISLGLTVAIMFQADYHYSETTVITSSVMIIVNLVTLINNFRKDTKYEAAAAKAEKRFKLAEEHNERLRLKAQTEMAAASEENPDIAAKQP